MYDLPILILLTVFHSCQDNVWVIMGRRCAMEPSLHLKDTRRLQGDLNPVPLDQQARAWPIELLGILCPGAAKAANDKHLNAQEFEVLA